MPILVSNYELFASIRPLTKGEDFFHFGCLSGRKLNLEFNMSQKIKTIAKAENGEADLATIHPIWYGIFMARPLRIELPGAVYNVTSRGNAKRAMRTLALPLFTQVKSSAFD
jgi:hypothetical protein